MTRASSPLYGCFFALGLYARRTGWRVTATSRASAAVSGLGLMLCIAVYFAARAHPDGTLAHRIFAAVAYSALAGQFVIFPLQVGSAVLSSTGSAARSLAANAFGIYLLHMPILLGFTLAARPLGLALVPKALAVGGLSFGATWALSAVGSWAIRWAR